MPVYLLLHELQTCSTQLHRQVFSTYLLFTLHPIPITALPPFPPVPSSHSTGQILQCISLYGFLSLLCRTRLTVESRKVWLPLLLTIRQGSRGLSSDLGSSQFSRLGKESCPYAVSGILGVMVNIGDHFNRFLTTKETHLWACL